MLVRYTPGTLIRISSGHNVSVQLQTGCFSLSGYAYLEEKGKRREKREKLLRASLLRNRSAKKRTEEKEKENSRHFMQRGRVGMSPAVARPALCVIQSMQERKTTVPLRFAKVHVCIRAK